MHRAGILAWALVSAGLMVVGAFGPWVTVLGTISVNGWTLEKKAAGIIVVLALLGAVGVWTRRTTAASGGFAFCTGLASALLAFYEHHHISGLIASSIPGAGTYGALLGGLVHVGWGLDLALAGSVSLTLAGLASFFVEADVRETQTRVAPSLPAVPAGWYRDPNDDAMLRYWNGLGWTTQTAKPAS